MKYSNVAATLAVAVALSSGAYAVTLAKGSVKARHLSKGAVTTTKLAKNSVLSTKVRNGSLKAVDFKAGEIPQGEEGEQGDPGLSELEYVREAFSGLAPGATGTYTVECPAGKSPISGGYEINVVAYQRADRAVSSMASTTTAYDAWQVMLQNVAMNGQNAAGHAYALCATVEGGFPNPGWATE